MAPDWYTLDSITLSSGMIKFHRSYKETSFANRNLVNNTSTVRVLTWPNPRACTVEATMYEIIQLEQPRAIVLRISSNQNDITSARLLLKSGSAGLRLHTADADVVEGDCQVTKEKQPSVVPLSKISPGSVIRIKIPYRIDGDLKEIIVRSELTYQVEEQTYIYASSHKMSALLPLGVNVQDIFKKNALFSKFAISTASEVPIRVLQGRLDENQSYDVSTPYMDDRGLMVYTKQPASLVYRITRKTVAPTPVRKRLFLKVDYQCLDEQIILNIRQRFKEDLALTEFSRLSTLLETHFKTVLIRQFQQQDLETAGLLQAVNPPSYATSGWDSVLAFIPFETRRLVESWLQEWHSKTRIISLAEETKAINRRIEIPVEIPSLPVLHTVSLAVDKRPASRPYAIGEIVTGELRIIHTRHWSAMETKHEGPLSFVYELEASAESWLVAGQRRGFFTAVEGESKVFPIMLLPLRAGKLMLPIVEVRSAREDDHDELSTCETDYQSLGTAVEVISGVTAVSVDVLTTTSGSLDGEVKVLEVERETQSVA